MSDLSSPRRKRRPPARLLALAAPVLLMGGAWGLAKAGVLPVAEWAGKNPAAQRALGAPGLSPARKAAAGAPPPDAAAPVAPPPAPPALQMPADASPPPAPRRADKDNAGRVARILATMDSAAITRLFAKMPDAEVAPLLLKMKPSTAGEIIAALPTARAVTLTRYLRRYPG